MGADEEPVPAGGAALEVAEVVERLERATASGDFGSVCDEVFTAAARRRAGGDGCERLTRAAAREISRPRIELTSIDIRGDTARVGVTTGADGRAGVPAVLEMRREGGEWRVEALGG